MTQKFIQMILMKDRLKLNIEISFCGNNIENVFDKYLS